MKLGENDRNIGHALGYFGEYSLAGIYLNEVNYDNENPHYDEAWIETDQDDYASVFETSVRDKILIDIFQSVPLCDLFLMWLNKWLDENTIDEDYKKQISDWYFSEKPKFKVF